MQLTFCIFLPMYHFAYFVGKMTHRPGDHRQNEPTSKSCAHMLGVWHFIFVFTNKASKVFGGALVLKSLCDCLPPRTILYPFKSEEIRRKNCLFLVLKKSAWYMVKSRSQSHRRRAASNFSLSRSRNTAFSVIFFVSLMLIATGTVQTKKPFLKFTKTWRTWLSFLAYDAFAICMMLFINGSSRLWFELAIKLRWHYIVWNMMWNVLWKREEDIYSLPSHRMGTC
jgi:hypothetical protein